MGEPLEFVTPVEHELRRQAHDVLHAHHERDFRTLAVFPVQALEDAKVVVLRADVRGRLLVEEVVGPNWHPQGWTICALIWKGHMVLAQPPDPFDLRTRLEQTTPVLGFGFYWHGRHDQPVSAPGKLSCRLCRPSRKAGDRITCHPKHSPLSAVAIAGGGVTRSEARRAVRGSVDGGLVLRELFAGHATLTTQWRNQGGRALEPVEVFKNPHTKDGYQREHVLLQPEIKALHLARARDGPENLGWLAAPCTSYCDWNLENGGSREGGATKPLTEREQQGNALSEFAAEYFVTMLDNGGYPLAESSGCSGRYPKQWDLPCWRKILARPDVDFVEFRMCSFGLGPPDEPGAYYQHLTRVVFPRSNATRCTEAGVYCPEFVQVVCSALQASLFVGGGVSPPLSSGDKLGKKAGGDPQVDGEDEEVTEEAGQDEATEAEIGEDAEGAGEDETTEAEITEDAGEGEIAEDAGEGEIAQVEIAEGAGEGEVAEKGDEVSAGGPPRDAFWEGEGDVEDEEFHTPEDGGSGVVVGTPDEVDEAVRAATLSSSSRNRPNFEALFGSPRDPGDTRGGSLDRWVRELRDGVRDLSPHHQEMTHSGVWAEEPLPTDQQGPGVPEEGEDQQDYMQTYTGGYVIIHHCRPCRELFHPGGVGFPIDPMRLRNERLSACRFSTGFICPELAR